VLRELSNFVPFLQKSAESFPGKILVFSAIFVGQAFYAVLCAGLTIGYVRKPASGLFTVLIVHHEGEVQAVGDVLGVAFFVALADVIPVTIHEVRDVPLIEQFIIDRHVAFVLVAHALPSPCFT
jgi:hypothetical protein